MSLLTITSPTNEAVKQVVRLHNARERKETQLFIVEGLRAIETAYRAGLKLQTLYCTHEMFDQAQAVMPHQKYVVVNSAVMKKMSTATTPSGLLAIVKIPPTPAADKLTPGLVLAQVHDPGNMGTLIRTAASCGIRSVVIVEGADPWSPKVVQASAGTIALVQLFEWDWATLVAAKKELQLYGLVVEGGASIGSVVSNRGLIVVGNEARGIPVEWQKDCDELVTLPMPGGTESLNAAVAGSIAVYMTFCMKKN